MLKPTNGWNEWGEPPWGDPPPRDEPDRFIRLFCAIALTLVGISLYYGGREQIGFADSANARVTAHEILRLQ